MSKWKKIAAVAAPAVMALAAAPADAKVLLMGDGGWEVSFDGSVNGFYSYTDADELPSGARDASVGSLSIAAPGADGDNEASSITTGLLPAVWGMNVKAPTTNGLDMSARIGIYPNIQNGRVKNEFDSRIDLREIFFQVDGSFGSVLVGRTLSLYQGKNILTDMTLFGVGAPNLDSALSLGTTLGRIGFGYVYPQFNAAIRFTTPDMNGVKLSAGIYQPSRLGGDGALNATALNAPRFEGEVSYAGDLGGASLSAWGSGMYQEANLTAAIDDKDETEAWGTAGGLQVGFAGLTLTASGYYGQGLGTTVMLDSDGFDAKAKGRRNVGYLAQGTYGFGQGTSVGVSYGLSRQFNTSHDKANNPGGKVREQNMLDVMLWHDINKNLRVVGEWSKVEIEWADNENRDGNTFSVGGFFFW